MEALTSPRFSPISASINLALVLLVLVPGTALASESSGALRLAYLDPATGSLIIQAVLGTLAAAAVTGRLYWTKIKGWLGMASAEQAPDGDLTSHSSGKNSPRDG